MIKTVQLTLLLALALTPSVVPASQDDTGSSVDQRSLAKTVNINMADADTLELQLVAIGRNKALAIVSHREKFGPFTVAKNKARTIVEE